jgi:hypothetical protein
MKLSSFGKPVNVTKDMHVFMLQSLIGTCSKLGSLVVDFVHQPICIMLDLLLLHLNFILEFF